MGSRTPPGLPLNTGVSSWGHFADGVLSFTDSDAMPGKTYAYVVYERGTKGAGPRSNPVTPKTL